MRYKRVSVQLNIAIWRIFRRQAKAKGMSLSRWMESRGRSDPEIAAEIDRLKKAAAEPAGKIPRRILRFLRTQGPAKHSEILNSLAELNGTAERRQERDGLRMAIRRMQANGLVRFDGERYSIE